MHYWKKVRGKLSEQEEYLADIAKKKGGRCVVNVILFAMHMHDWRFVKRIEMPKMCKRTEGGSTCQRVDAWIAWSN